MSPLQHDIYQEIGVASIINAAGTVSAYSGSLMWPEVSDAMNRASRAFVVMEELHLAAGRRIAQLIGVEAAHVCASATAGMALMAAAVIAGQNREHIRQLPDVTGLQHEIVIQRTQRIAYDQSLRLVGAKFIEVAPELASLEAAINERTAALFYIYSWGLTGPQLALEEVAQVAQTHGLPMIVDAASELPPMANLHRFLDAGGDLVTFSGGKGLRGPQASGLVLGRADLVEACRLNDSPNAAVGRAMKTGKEEIIGLVKAVEIYMSRNHAADMALWERRVAYLLEQIGALPHVQAWRQLPYGVGQLFPHVAMTWDLSAVEVSYQEFFEQMLAGPPRIVTQPYHDPLRDNQEQMRIHVHCLQEGEDVILAQRIRELLG